jgi:hypothetical protein
MSGVNSAAGAAAAAAAAASTVEAAIAMELAALAADAKALQGMLMTGDIVQATVQPYNGITDTLQIFGLRVAASLPPNVFPGDTLTVAVQGFNNDQVIVQVMSRTPGANAPTPAASAAAAAAAAQAEDSVELTRMPIPVLVDEPEFPPLPSLPPPAPPASAAAAPSDDVVPSPSTGAAAAAAAAAEDEALAAQNTVVQTPAASVQQTDYAQARPETLSLEARLAFARSAPPPPPSAGAASRTVPPPRPAAEMPPQHAAGTAAARIAAQRATTPPAAARANAAPPPVASRAPFAPIITPRPDVAAKAQQPLPGSPGMRSTTMMPASQTRPQPAPTPEELLEDPAALLRALRIPQTPTTLTFARLVTQQPEQVATALRALEAALPDSDDPRIQTLRTLAAFVGNLDPESETFTSQVTSYISHVVEGPEQKLAMLLVQEQPPETAAAATPAAEEAPAPAPAQNAAPPAPVTPATPTTEDPTVAAAHSVERLAAVDADLKTQLVSLLASVQPESALGETGAVLARNALTGLVASQLTALAGQQNQPATWSFTVPIMLGQQMYPARIAVSRDKPEGQAEKVSGDDFHIAFILDTKRLGTIAIDLHAVQRSVSVAVRTERPSAATTFKSALSQLGKRLEEMRYNVKSLEAGTTRVKTPVAESDAPPPSDSLSAMDKKA